MIPTRYKTNNVQVQDTNEQIRMYVNKVIQEKQIGCYRYIALTCKQVSSTEQ